MHTLWKIWKKINERILNNRKKDLDYMYKLIVIRIIDKIVNYSRKVSKSNDFRSLSKIWNKS